MFKHYLMGGGASGGGNDSWWVHSRCVGTETPFCVGDIDTLAGIYLNIYNLDIEDYIMCLTNGSDVNYAACEIRAAIKLTFENLEII